MWAKIISILLGVWLIVSPDIFAMSKQGTNNNYIVGPLVITFAVIALWEINRNVIKANYLVAAWIFISPLFVDYNSNIGLVSNFVAAILIILLARVPSKTTQSFGGGWASLMDKDPKHARQTGS